MPPLRCLFVHNRLSTFVRIDRDLLAERFVVREWYQRGRAFDPIALRRAVAASDLIFGWFASWHTLFPVLIARRLGKPAVLVVGGYDVANRPEIGYGSMRGGFKRWVARTTMREASQLVPFSESARRETLLQSDVSPERVTTIYLGVPQMPAPDAPKEKRVLTVGNVDRVNLTRKGLLPFVRAAAAMPDVPFVLAGEWLDDAIETLRRAAVPNVTFTGRLDEANLRAQMARACVYVQASAHEGFGLAVAEAMLCECLPVVTRVGALPEVVGDAGVYAESADARVLANAIRQALAADDASGKRARERIETTFSLERRQRALYVLLERVMHESA